MRGRPDYSWNIFINGSSSLGQARGDVEDEVSEALDEMAEVTGGGAGEAGWNIDIEVHDGRDVEHCVQRVREILLGVGVAAATKISIVRTEERRLG